jgi:DNA anti-recombination protein RmuC
MVGASAAEDQDMSAGDVKLRNLARQLKQMQAEVDELAEEVKLEKDQLRNTLNRLSTQKSNKLLTLDQQQTTLEDINKQIENQKQEIAQKKEAQESLRQPLLKQIDQVKDYVRVALPYKVRERLGELEKLRQEVVQEKGAPEELLARLWSMVEDEFRLTKEIGSYQQRIELDGQPAHADIVKLGMVMMYFRTGEKEQPVYGMAVPSGDDWRYVTVSDDAQVKMIVELFDALRKHIREGQFKLPNPYSQAGK